MNSAGPNRRITVRGLMLLIALLAALRGFVRIEAIEIVVVYAL